MAHIKVPDNLPGILGPLAISTESTKALRELADDEYRSKLSEAGFEHIDIEPTRVYRAEDAREFLSAAGVDVDAIAPEVEGKFLSAFVRAVKPPNAGAKACCGPTCCN